MNPTRVGALLRRARRLPELAHDPQLREVLKRRAFFKAAKRFTPAVAVESDGVRYFVSTHDAHVSCRTFEGREYGLEAMRRIFAVLDAELGGFSLDGKTVVEVGGNIGTQTVSFLLRFGAGHVVVFEPDPRNFQLLRQNLLVNDVEDRATPVCAALSDDDGFARFELSEHNWGDHRVRIAGNDGQFGEDRRKVLDVPTVRFDTAVERGDLRLQEVGLVWADTQGHEGHVLVGAQTLMTANLPVVVEYWPYGLRRAGGLDLFHEQVAAGFERVVDVRAEPPRSLAAGEVAGLEGGYGGDQFASTDLVLLPSQSTR